jgi:hypothetical protein
MSKLWLLLFLTWCIEERMSDKSFTVIMEIIKSLKIYEVLSPGETTWLISDPWEFAGWSGRDKI